MTPARIILCLICIVTLLAAAVGAQSPRAVASASSYEFGTLKQGERVIHTFVVRNEGVAPLTLQRAELSATGMTAKFKPSIAPGEDGAISIEWNTASVAGKVQGRAVVHCNDSAQPQLIFVLEGTVKPPIDLLPFPAVFASVFQGESAERTVRIVNNGDRPLRIERIEPAGQHFKARLETVKEGKEYELVVKVPPDVSPGRYTEAVYLDTDHPTLSRLTVTVNLLVKTDVYVNPEVVDFGQISLGDVARYPQSLAFTTETFMVKKRQGDFEIKSISSDLPLLAISRAPASGRSAGFRIDVGLNKNELRPGKFEGTIHIQTDDKRFPELAISVHGEVR